MRLPPPPPVSFRYSWDSLWLLTRSCSLARRRPCSKSPSSVMGRASKVGRSSLQHAPDRQASWERFRGGQILHATCLEAMQPGCML